MRFCAYVFLSILTVCLLDVLQADIGFQTEDRRQLRDTYPFGKSSEAPEYEIVVARYGENATTLAWLAELPAFYQVTIINKVQH